MSIFSRPGFTPTAVALDAAMQADIDAGRNPMANDSLLSLAVEAWATCVRDGCDPDTAAALAAIASGTAGYIDIGE